MHFHILSFLGGSAPGKRRCIAPALWSGSVCLIVTLIQIYWGERCIVRQQRQRRL
jgi:hypothetical protein